MEVKIEKQIGRHLLCKNAELKSMDPLKVYMDKVFVSSLNGDGN